MRLLQAITLRGLLWAAVSVVIWWSTHGALMVFDRWFEYVLFPKSLLMFGDVNGVAVMTVASFVICLVLIWTYDWFARLDWSHVTNPILRKFLTSLQDALGFETLKEVAGEVREEIFVPVEFVSPGAKLPRQLEWLRPLAAVAFELGALVQNIGLWVWEVIRFFLVAPVARVLFRHRLEKVALFLYASLVHEPMTTLILMRPVRTYGMAKKEWAIFLGSVVIGNVSWGVVIAVGMHVVETYFPWLWRLWLQIINLFT